MQRKNIIFVLAILMVICSMGITGYFYSSNNQSNQTMEEPPNHYMGDISNSNDNMDKPDDSNNSSSDNNTPPEKPDGDNNSNGSMPNGQIPNMNQNNNTSYIYYILFTIESLVLSILLVYFVINKKTLKQTYCNKDKLLINVLLIIILTAVITYSDIKLFTNTNSNRQINTSSDFIKYSAKKEITEDENITNGDYESTNSDENAILVNGDIDVNLSNISVSKSGDSKGDDSNFYGNNSAILAINKSNLSLKNITVNTNASGANGVFCYGGSNADGTTINISDSFITTTKDNSGGIMVAGGGTIKASNLTINTAGTSSAAIRSDKGGGTMTVNNGSYTTTGVGSPAIYSTADITVSDATLTSKASEGVVIEGNNSVILDNVELTDTNNKLNGQSTTYKNIFLYQSMSGDAEEGNAVFSAKDSKIITNKGDSFYVTNTTATINLNNNTIVNNDNGNFLRVQSDSWGIKGSNGGNVTLNMNNQKAFGNIVIDSISTVDITMVSSSYEGIINGDNSAKKIELKLDKSSTIKLSGDSYISSFDNEDTTNNNINFNGYKLYVNGKSIN